jgi:hypothetical protein
VILLVSASWVARIIGMSHWCPARFSFLWRLNFVKCISYNLLRWPCGFWFSLLVGRIALLGFQVLWLKVGTRGDHLKYLETKYSLGHCY